MERACASEDAELLRLIADGDEAALGALYDRHAGWLLVRLGRRCAAGDLVDQALQDTFLAVWRQAGRYRGDGNVAAFLWGIAVRRLLDLLRREGARAGVTATGEVPEPQAALVRSAEEEVLLGIEYGRLGPALGRLSPELRAAMQATVIDGLTYKEAARLLGVPAGTVKSRCHRARTELREALA